MSESELHPFIGTRGLRGFTRFTASYGETVTVQESSAVELVGDSGTLILANADRAGLELRPGGYCWLRIEGRVRDLGETAPSASAHLSVGEAREVRDALTAFIDWADGEDEDDAAAAHD